MLKALTEIAPHLPSSLFGTQALERMSRVAARLPPGLSNFWGFECRLAEDAAEADILFQTRRGAPGVSLLAGESPSALETLYTEPAWGNLRDFATRWQQPDLALHRLVRNIWLEFDIAGVSDTATLEHAIRQPNLFIGPDATSPKRDLIELLEGLCHCHGRFLAALETLPAFLDALPEGARAFQLGLMLTRPADHGLRVCVNEVPTDEIGPWLQRLFDSPTARALVQVVEAMQGRTEALSFGFNLTPAGLEPGLGLECYQSWKREDRPQWAPLLDELVARGLCLPHKRDGLLAYPGKLPVPKDECLINGRLFLETHRRIHHVKLTLTFRGVMQAKAYLAVSRPGLIMGETLGGDTAGAHPPRDAWTLE